MTSMQARYVLDWSDHVWTEYWSDDKHRWVHVDPCEAAYDRPLLYEVLQTCPPAHCMVDNLLVESAQRADHAIAHVA